MKCRWLVMAGSSLTLTRLEHFNEVSAKTEIDSRLDLAGYAGRRHELMDARPATEGGHRAMGSARRAGQALDAQGHQGGAVTRLLDLLFHLRVALGLDRGGIDW